MRTLFFTCVAFVSLSAMALAQETSNTVTAQSKTELLASKESGNYTFTLPEGITPEEVSKNAKYYVHYFTVEYIEKSNQAKLTMISNDEKSRHVIVRFLTACGAQHVVVDGKSMSIEDFFNNYLL